MAAKTLGSLTNVHIDFFLWLQSTRVATTIANSLFLLAGLSAVHLVGLTLLVGGTLVSSLRMAGIFLAGRPVADITGDPDRGVVVGLGISVVTGLLLFAPRASAAGENGVFQLKMCLLIAAASFHFTARRRIIRQPAISPGQLRRAGLVGLALWISVALAGCAFIFFE